MDSRVMKEKEGFDLSVLSMPPLARMAIAIEFRKVPIRQTTKTQAKSKIFDCHLFSVTCCALVSFITHFSAALTTVMVAPSNSPAGYLHTVTR